MSTAFTASAFARWRANPVLFVEEVLTDPESGKAFVLLPAERTFLQHAFKRDENGKLLYGELIYACPKKSGKTTLAAIFTLTLLILFGGTHAEAIICANSFEQSVGRVHQVIRRIIEASPQLRAEAKLTEGKITIAGATILAIPSDYTSAAGSNQNIAVFDELWAYDRESARRLFDELVPVPTRQTACRLTVTYAGFSGESELLEELYKRGLQQQQVAPDLYAGDGMLMFWTHQPVAPWQDERWLAEMRRSLRTNQFLRLIENRFVSSDSSFIDMSWWDRCVDPNLSPVVADQGLPIWIGIDASTKHDSTAVVATCWDKATQRVRLVHHRVFQPSPDRPLDFELSVEGTVLDLSQRFHIRKVLFDPYQMQASAQRLTKQGIVIEEFKQSTPNLTAASQNLFELIQGGNLLVYPDAAMRLAVSRAIALETSRGWHIAKDKQVHKIDVVVALGMAAWATVQGQSEPDYDHLYIGFQPDPPNSDPFIEEGQQRRRAEIAELMRRYGQPPRMNF